MSTKKAYIGDPEVTPQGVRKKGSGPPTGRPSVRVVHKHEKRGKLWLRSCVAGTLFVDTAAGLMFIFGYFDEPDAAVLRTNLMWMFGSVHAAALATVLFVQLE